jgi:GGDEF domain-containing protein
MYVNCFVISIWFSGVLVGQNIMKHYFNTHRIWFRAAATGIACLFLFNNIVSAAGRPVSSIKNIHTLSATSGFNPITLTKGRKDDLGFVKDQMEVFDLVQDFQEKAGFIYLSLLISRALARGVASKLSAQGLRNLIKKQIPHIDFKKIHLEEMYKKGNDVYCLPFTPEKGAKTVVLRYYVPPEESSTPFSRNSMPIGIGNVRIECEGLENILRRARISTPAVVRNRREGTDQHVSGGQKPSIAPEHTKSQENISSEIPESRETGMREGKDRLRRINFGAKKDYYFMLGDVDKLSNRNKIYSKGVIGSLGKSIDPDVVFSKKSLFREILATLAEECNAEELEVYRYLAGDEFVPQYERGSVDEVEAKLNLIREAFKNHFENRYAVVKVVTKGDNLTKSEQISLVLNENVMALVKYGSGYHVLLKRNGTDLRIQLQILNENMEHDLLPHEFNKGTIPAFTVSIGAISARSIIDSLGGDALLDEAGYIKTEELDRVYTWGMRIANDMLLVAKETRDTVFVSDSIDPEVLKKPIKLEKEEPVEDGLDRLTGFYNQGRFRDEAEKKKNLVLFEVTTYNGHPSREIGGFHAVNSALGYDDANDVIAIMAEELKAVLDDMKIGDVVLGRAPPDQFFISMDQDIDPALLEVMLTSVKKRVEDRLAKRFGESGWLSRLNRRTAKQFPFNIKFKISAVSSKEIESSHIPEFNNVFRIIDIIAKLEKAVEITGAVEAIRAIIHREVDGAGEIRIYSSDNDKEELLQENYRAIQEREKQEAMDNARHVTAKPDNEAEDTKTQDDPTKIDQSPVLSEPGITTSLSLATRAKTIEPTTQRGIRMDDAAFDEAANAAKEKAIAGGFIDAVVSRQLAVDDPEKKLFVFFGTKWIKGYQKGEDAESDSINKLLVAVRQFCGKWGIEFAVEGDEENWSADIKARQDANKDAKFVVVTGEKTVVTPEFRVLGENENTVLAGISNEDLTVKHDLYVLQMLTVLIRIASGEETGSIDTEILIKMHDKFPEIYVLSLPPARLLGIDKQKRKYHVQEETIRKAA